MKKGKLIGTLVTVVILFGAIGACSNDSSSKPSISTNTSTTTQQKPVETPKPKEQFTVLEHHAEKDSTGYIKIKGKIKNNTDKTFGYVQVEINLFDAQGNQIGSALDNLNNFGAGATWSFEALGLTDKAVKYQIVEVNGF